MAKYMIRVELHDADEDDYETLHELMAAAGCGRTVTGSNNEEYQLPTAEYLMDTETDYTAASIRNHIQECISSLELRKWIFVTRSSSMAWLGKKA